MHAVIEGILNVMMHRIVVRLVALMLLACALPASADKPVILVLGDSLSAAFGIQADIGWVALLQRRLDQEGYRYQVVNASISGDTTAGAAARLPRALKTHAPQIVLVQLGGNDGLRGLPLSEMQKNLSAIIDDAKDSGAQVLLLGMRLPPNYGPAYTRRFEAIYAELARHHRVLWLPFMLAGVAERTEMMQGDGVHPVAEAQPKILENVWPKLVPLLRR
jgi:acyl-CoA thioesterase-1